MKASSSGSNPKISGIICMIVCLLFAAVAAKIFYDSVTFNSKYDEVTAKVVDIDTYRRSNKKKHYAYVSYEYEGQSYSHVYIGKTHAGMRVGEQVNVYVDPKNPDEAKQKPSGAACLVLLLAAGFLGFSGVRLLRSSGGSGKRDLKGRGVPVTALVKECGPSGIRLNKRDTYHVVAEYTDATGKTRTFKSGLLDFDPTSYVYGHDGKITVYLDPDRPSKYFMDTEEMKFVCQQKNAYNSPSGFNGNI